MSFGASKTRSRAFRPMASMWCIPPFAILSRIFLFIRSAPGKITNLTNSGVTESEPVWSPDGKYVFSLHHQLPSPNILTAHAMRISIRMPLQKYDEDFKLNKFNDLFTEVKKDSTPVKTRQLPLSPMIKNHQPCLRQNHRQIL
jgi:hypothetical protein